jgi:hypothetical protein
VLSASLDGTVRARDLTRYRNFRTLVTPQPAQLTCLAVDPAGEVHVFNGFYLTVLSNGFCPSVVLYD